MSICKVKNNPNSGETELWIDGEFQASLGVTLRLSLASRRIVEEMLHEAVVYGRIKKLKEIHEALGVSKPND